jgi:hypothetical protein
MRHEPSIVSVTHRSNPLFSFKLQLRKEVSLNYKPSHNAPLRQTDSIAVVVPCSAEVSAVELCACLEVHKQEISTN